MSELVPCPFCGGKAETLTAESMYGGYLFGIMCNDCRSRGDVYDTEAEAIAAWNTRADYHGYEQAAIEAWESIKAWNTRAERTCKLHDCEGSFSAVNKPVWRCDCGAFMTQYTDATTYHKPRFCPNCGAFFKEYDELRGDAE